MLDDLVLAFRSLRDLDWNDLWTLVAAGLVVVAILLYADYFSEMVVALR